MLRDELLKKQYGKITESKLHGALPIEDKFKPIFERLIFNQMKYYVKEESSGTVSGDIARLGTVLVSAYRRAFAQMIGKYIAGVQPMKESTGYAFALRYHFAGNSQNNGANTVKGGGNTGFTALSGNWTPADNQRSAVNSLILVWDTTAHRQTDAPDVGYGSAPAAGTGELTGLVTIIYSEANKAVIRLAGATTIAQVKALKGATGSNIIDYYDNEAGYLNILKNYPGPLSTLVAEKLGDDTDEYAISVDKIGIQALELRAAARMSLESIEDLKASHGKDLEKELSDILYYELAQSIDRQIIDAVNSIAVSSNYNCASVSNGGDSDGRWEMERFRAMYTQIVRRSADIARTTLRGCGNQVVATPDVITALSQLHGFTGIAPVGGTATSLKPVDASQSAFAGTMDGKLNVYMDIFAGMNDTGNYATILYKGQSAWDAPVIYCPYIPAAILKTVDPVSGNPRLIIRERSAISSNIFGSDLFVRKMNITNLF